MAMPSDLLVSTLADSPHAFIQPSLPLYTDTLAYLKHALDPLAADVSSTQQQRLQEARKKRKRGDKVDQDDVLRFKQIHTQGFTVEQIWEQARRVIDAAAEEAERGVEEAETRVGVVVDLPNGDVDSDDVSDSDSDSDSESDLGEEGVDYEVEGEDDGDEESDETSVTSEDVDFDGKDDFDEDMILNEEAPLGNDEPADEFVADKFGLNDGFFSIDDFNRQSDFLEQQDTRGENDGAASDEEDVDWDTNPLGQLGGDVSTNGAAGASDDEDDEDDGPTFGDPDAPSEDEDEELNGDEMDIMGGMSNTNNVMYADFFAPPAQKKKKNKKGRPNPHNFPDAPEKNAAKDDEPGEDDMERTMAAVHRDLFEDEESEDDASDEEGKQLDPADPRSRKSAHERRKAALAEEIRKLEAANVAKRQWTLSGEARAADRPLNSLLEEDLEFERAGKPVPVITAEVSESIEDLIKRRILAHDFQDIVRRRPDDLATGKDGRRGRLDYVLDDSKSKKGLAEEYEEEHLRRTDANFVDVKDEKVKKEEKEIEALWKQVCSDLDGLSSWHFRPKAPAPQLDIRVDAPAIAMEDARPSAGGEVAGASQLAPQEMYRAGEGTKGVREEVVGKSGLPAGREELSREEKKRRRRREKERKKKEGGGAEKAPKGRDAVVGDLKKGGVKVIGKKGDVTDVEGRGVRTEGGQQGAGRYKL
ncbi:U3 small nucleolar ribonucleoprotein complex, subunit Mpp10 [Neohortaea acidophila]|uniref:U3 small nucleolar ribonucleoprotein protein MPP10 n=1 Tax=Neohortaea acidophila TaxID=245834 RepID=A0A6A6PKD4_9PEZI|nr:U3 small nucleolar ribonucleoprotein complex, subunit Mpp10 [Neohortaea acidophila]KAF2479963.1 U3 small nucleolar ribonucleoprotein complex, subunit Mpp10 [Neohortaea acidophila]